MNISEIKSNILSRSIDEDQSAVITQWTKTFIHNGKDSVAIKLSKLLFAAIYQGDFKTRSSLADQVELSNPNSHLTCIDYLSHGSRIIIDYEQLSTEYQQELLQYFPDPDGHNGVFSRTATHAVCRFDGKIIEKKGFRLGVQALMLSLVAKHYDFGVNIAMGGTHQINFVGKQILPNGFSGHVYFHRYHDQNLLMGGIEQNTPPLSTFETLQSLIHSVTPSQSEASDDQVGTDQFGQSHSLSGASDVFTAAGSLYFNDPIYQAKLLIDKGCFPPDKYGGMIVTVTNENWSSIKECLLNLEKTIDSADEAALRDTLQCLPKTACDKDTPIPSYISLMFDVYLARAYEGFILTSELSEKEKEFLSQLQQQFLNSIIELQKGKLDFYHAFLSLSQDLLTLQSLPKAYIEAIQRIKDLFKLQLEKDPHLLVVHQELLFKEQYEGLQIRLTELYPEVRLIREYLESSFIIRDHHLSSHLKSLEELEPTLLLATKRTSDSPEIPDEKGVVDPGRLINMQELVSKTELLLSQSPRLCSEQSLRDLLAQQESLILQYTALKEQNKQRIVKKMEIISPFLVNMGEIKANCTSLNQPEQSIAFDLLTHLDDEKQKFLALEDLNDEAAVDVFKKQCNQHINSVKLQLITLEGWDSLLTNALTTLSRLVIDSSVTLSVHRSQSNFFKLSDKERLCQDKSTLPLTPTSVTRNFSSISPLGDKSKLSGQAAELRLSGGTDKSEKLERNSLEGGTYSPISIMVHA